jgi:hypothetical protein
MRCCRLASRGIGRWFEEAGPSSEAWFDDAAFLAMSGPNSEIVPSILQILL